VSNKTDQGDFRFDNPYFIEAMSHLMTREMLVAKLNVKNEERETYRSELPVFGVSADGVGLANEHTGRALYEHITKAALLASRMVEAAMEAVSRVNAHMREHSKPARRFTVSLHQDMFVRPNGQVETVVRVRSERVE
jgi:hypothetical protein